MTEDETKKTPDAWGAKSRAALFVSFALFIVSLATNFVFVARETFAIWPFFVMLATAMSAGVTGTSDMGALKGRIKTVVRR